MELELVTHITPPATQPHPTIPHPIPQQDTFLAQSETNDPPFHRNPDPKQKLHQRKMTLKTTILLVPITSRTQYLPVECNMTFVCFTS